MVWRFICSTSVTATPQLTPDFHYRIFEYFVLDPDTDRSRRTPRRPNRRDHYRSTPRVPNNCNEWSTNLYKIKITKIHATKRWNMHLFVKVGIKKIMPAIFKKRTAFMQTRCTVCTDLCNEHNKQLLKNVYNFSLLIKFSEICQRST